MQIKNYENILFESIYLSVLDSLNKICDEKDSNYILNKITKNNDFFKSICLLPYWFFNCFENKNDIDIYNEIFILGKANLQGFIAYTLYDYIRDKKIDKEYIDISLSIANIFSQKSISDFHAIVDYDKNKTNIIDNLLNTMDIYYLDNQVICDIHYHFKYMCDNTYKKSIGMSIVCLIVIWLLGYETESNNFIETLDFFKNYLNARQLSDDEDDMCDDILNNIYTPATLLMRAQYGSDYIHTMIRSRIDTYQRTAIDSLKNIEFFDFEKFIELYVKDC